MPEVEIALNTLPMWSRFTLTIDLRFDGVSTFKTQFTPGRIIPCFAYKQGDQTVRALEGSAGTDRDTILVQSAQTRGGALFDIKGMSITKDGWAYDRADSDAAGPGTKHTLFPPSSIPAANGALPPIILTVEDFRALDGLFAHVFNDFFHLNINVDGVQRTLTMGPVPFYPATGGTGATGNVDTTNGPAFVNNYTEIPEGIKWNPAGSVDSNMVANLIAAYECVTPTWTTPTGTANGEPVSGTNPTIANPNPTPIGRRWTQAFLLRFHGKEYKPTSNVS